MSLDTPVVLFAFNRPHLARQVFSVIAAARPKHLFLVMDGPRPDRPDEAQRVAATRAILEQVEWPCKVQRNYVDVNCGARERIVSGLRWVFDLVGEAIILEDDCVPDPTFFPFCEELLQRFRKDERITAICGSNTLPGPPVTQDSYFFSKYFSPWGWATWRRVWDHFDPEMRSWPQFVREGGLHAIADSPEEEAYFGPVLENVWHHLQDAWDYPFQFYSWTRQGLTVNPRANLVRNIGCNLDGTHCQDPNAPYSNVPLSPIGPLRHPVAVVRNVEVDRRKFRHKHCLEGTPNAPQGPARHIPSPNTATRLAERIYQLESRVLNQAAQLEEKEGVIQVQHRDILRLHRELEEKERIIQLQHRDKGPHTGAGQKVSRADLPRRALMSIRSLAKWMQSGRRSRTVEPRPIPLRLRPLLHASKVIVGAAHTYYPGWHSTDRDVLDVTRRSDFARFWQPGTRAAFLAEHLWEHLTLCDAKRALGNCFEFLQPGGRLRIAVPDGLHPDPRYRDYVRPGGTGPGAGDHKVIYDYVTLTALLQEAGFKVLPLEYWDEHGQLHCQEWSADHGPIRRTAGHQECHSTLPFRYTSLIVDGIRPAASERAVVCAPKMKSAG
jgi:predicted SAM-dependent methyltransferase